MATDQMINKKTLTLVGTVVTVLIGGIGVSLALSNSSAKNNENPIAVTTTSLEPEMRFGNPTTVPEEVPTKVSEPSTSTTSVSVPQPANAISGVISDDDGQDQGEQDDDD
ncbi:MAG: hypothetical protein WCG40_05195 [Actinomycetes bacterium]